MYCTNSATFGDKDISKIQFEIWFLKKNTVRALVQICLLKKEDKVLFNVET